MPKTPDATQWRKRLNKCKSKNGSSRTFCWHPLPRYVKYASKAEVDRPALKPNESCDQLQQWYATARSLPHSQCCWKGSGLPYRPEGNGFCPSNEWTPRSAPPAPRTQSHSSHEFSPMWKLCSKYADTCHLERLTKNKTAVNNPENYAKHGTSKALTNVSFRDHVTSTLTCLETRLKWDKSW